MNNRGGDDLNIVLYGGAFDPPHIGHVSFCKALSQQPEYDQVWVLPSYSHPFGKDLSNYQYRLEMSSIAFAALSDKVLISREESTVGGKGYTLDLLRHLKAKYPQHSFTLALGTDNFQSRHRWKGFEEIKRTVQVKFYGRKGWEGENTELGLGAPFPDVSSSQLREMLCNDERPVDLLPEGILDYIEKKELYCTKLD